MTEEEKEKETFLKTYQEDSARTRNNFMQTQFLLIEGALGLAGESGEFADLVKKNIFQGHELDKEKAALELGDILWYIALAASALNIDLETVAAKNIDKLKKRFPNGFSPKDSRERKD